MIALPSIKRQAGGANAARRRCVRLTAWPWRTPVARRSPADGPEWLGMSDRELLGQVAMGRLKPRMAYGTGGSDEGGYGTRRCTEEGGDAIAGKLNTAAGTWGLGMSNREQHWEVSMRRFEPRMAPGSGGSDGGGNGTRRCTGGGGRRSSC
jgi:hypothetical protein